MLSRNKTLMVLTNKAAVEPMRLALSKSADVIYIDTTPFFGRGRRYSKIFLCYPDQAWLDWKSYFEDHARFLEDYVQPMNSWLLPGGAIHYV